MESTSLNGNEKTCAVIHVEREQVEEGSGDMKIADLKPIKSLDQHNAYKPTAPSPPPPPHSFLSFVACSQTIYFLFRDRITRV